MNMDWENIFKLPEAAYVGGKRITKTVLSSRAMLTKHEQRTLDKMHRLEHFATVTKGTSHVLPRVDDDYDIQTVIFLRCEMAGDSQAVAEIARLLHGCFPNPNVILQEAGDNIAVSVGLSRRSHAERGATVVYDVESTGLFKQDDARYKPFLDSLAFDCLPQIDLLSYIEALSTCVKLSRTIKPLGFYPVCAPNDRARLLGLIADYERQQGAVDVLTEQRQANDVTPNESAKLRMRIRKAERQCDETIVEIESICNTFMGSVNEGDR